ncbi:universal stress protein [Maribacter sp. 2308TA10-17]|uniref:universal stress protein n=1 Tax=Maribacter sp. 2308TA10-17 TaxID=3386276 RepID=UPI0039BC31A6
MKNILIATDFSFNAYSAIFYATQLLNGKPGKFYLLNVYNENTPLKSNSGGKNLLQQLADESNEGLIHSYHRIQLDEPDSKHIFKTISKKGELTDVIAKTIKEKKIDLVVMGNSGCSEIEAIFLGSNVLRAIRDIKDCPILTIPKQLDFKPPQEIAFVTDHKSLYDAGLLQPLRFIARKFKSKIRILHINEDEPLSEKQHINRGVLLEYLSDFKYSLNWMPLFKSKASTINNFLEELNIDMLVMVNYEHSFLERISHEPVIKRVAFDLDIPFLVIPYQD